MAPDSPRDQPAVVHTVLGPIRPNQLGPTSMHEHLLLDGRDALLEPDDQPLEDPVRMDSLGDLRWNAVAMPDNLTLDSVDAAAAELAAAGACGCEAVVELTLAGLHPRVEDLEEVARASGVTVMVGCGYYVDLVHPPELERLSEGDIAGSMLEELENGRLGTDVRPALIGEIGTSLPVTASERKVLVASAFAAAASGAAINVHLHPQGLLQAREIHKLLVDNGAPPDRVVFSHCDEILDLPELLALMDQGAVVEFDLFGTEFYYPGRGNYVTDFERMEAVTQIVNRGHERQLVVGCDVHMKMMLRRYGGMGYEHVWKRIIPRLRADFDLGEDAIRTITTENPRRLLSR